MQQLIEELPLHILVFLCGAFGFVATKWVNRRWWCRCGSQPSKSSEEDSAACEEKAQLQPYEHVAHEAASKGSVGTHDAVCAGVAETGQGISRAEDTVESIPVPQILQDTLESTAAVQAPQDNQIDEEETAECKTAPMSNRIAKLMAKKAERKARKMQESLQAQKQTLASSPLPVHEKIACLARIPEHGDSDGEVYTNGTQEVAICTKVSEVDLAELSTADEGQHSWDVVETDSSEDDEAMSEEYQNPAWLRSIAEQANVETPSDSAWWWSDMRPRTRIPPMQDDGWMLPSEPPANSDDGWMLPFDELLNRRACCGHVLGGGAQFADVAAMGLQCEPVLSADGKQLYTDGSEFFVLAHDSFMGQEQPAVQLEAPTWDPCNPMHALLMSN